MNLTLSKKIGLGDISEQIPSDVRQYIGRAWLIGSRARGDVHSQSDIDLLIEPKNLTAFDLSTKMKKLIPSGDYVDTVVSYGHGSPVNAYRRNRLHFVIANHGEEKLFPERISLN